MVNLPFGSSHARFASSHPIDCAMQRRMDLGRSPKSQGQIYKISRAEEIGKFTVDNLEGVTVCTIKTRPLAPHIRFWRNIANFEKLAIFRTKAAFPDNKTVAQQNQRQAKGKLCPFR